MNLNSKLLKSLFAGVLLTLFVLPGAPFAQGPVLASTIFNKCSYVVPSGSVFNPQDGLVLFPNGTVASITSLFCGDGISFSTTGWAASGHMQLSSSYYYTNFQDGWTVPPGPSAGGSFAIGQAVALFDALQGAGQIVQPVLDWGCVQWTPQLQCTAGGNKWTIFAEANFQRPAYDVKTTPIDVSPGDSLVGTVIYDPHISFCPFNGPGYSIGAGDSTIGQTTTLIQCTGATYQDGVAGALEVKSLNTCNQMPGGSGLEYFQSISYTTSPSGGAPSQNIGSNNGFCSASALWLSGPTLRISYLNS